MFIARPLVTIYWLMWAGADARRVGARAGHRPGEDRQRRRQHRARPPVDAAVPGTRLRTADVLKTGADGSVGVTMSDNSLLSAGPNSILSFDRYEFDSTTNQGQFDASLKRGSLSVVSGRIAKQSPDAMTVRTPSAILGVRGTEFVVSADD